MTQGDYLKEYLEDPYFKDKYKLSKEELKSFDFRSSNGIKIVEVLKIAISSVVIGDPHNSIIRKLNQFLNR